MSKNPIDPIERRPSVVRWVSDRYSYDKEKRSALETWAGKLDEIVNPQHVKTA